MLGVLFYFVGSAVKQSEFNNSVATIAINFNPIASAWFETFYFLFLLISIVIAILSNAIHSYKLALLAFLAVGFSSLISSLNDNIYITSSAGSALLAAGAIFLSVAFGLFILILGSDENSGIHNAFNQLGSILNLNPPMASRQSYHENKGNRFQPTFQSPPQQQAYQPQPHASVVPQLPIVMSPNRTNTQSINNNNNFQSSAIPLNISTINSSGVVSSIATPPATNISTPVTTTIKTDVIIKAKALYEYTANKEDPHEISFAKGEILEILDNKGKWWKARRSDGSTVGIAPSNYLQAI
jgi:SHO1 osmosensor